MPDTPFQYGGLRDSLPLSEITSPGQLYTPTVHIEDARAPHSPLGTPATTATAASRPEAGHSSSGDHPLPPEQ